MLMLALAYRVVMMTTMPKQQRSHQPSTLLQFVVNFAIPIIILTRFSSESSLGPIKAMLLALAFPVAFEIHNVYKRKKLSLLSVIAIGGILVTGAISLLGLSEGWLAVRRSVPYFAVAVALAISIKINRSLLNALLPQMIDMDKVRTSANKKRAVPQLNQQIARSGYILSFVFVIVGVISYILTRIVITSETGTSSFNSEYARLRILSLPFITLPLLVGLAGTIMYLFAKIEKLTGLKSEDLLKKKR
jgi:hypothetical protein